MSLRKITEVCTIDHCSASYVSEDMSTRATADASFMLSEWWVNRVVVNPPNVRGLGIGGELLDNLKRLVAKAGGKTLWVTPGAYDGNLRRQQNFYRQHGFKPTKERGTFMAELKEPK